MRGRSGWACWRHGRPCPSPTRHWATSSSGIAAPLLTYPPDGSYEEGPGYWHYGLGECLPFCWALWLASGGALDLFSLPFLRNTASYALHVRTPDGRCFEVEDGASRWSAGWMLAVLGRRLQDGAASALARQTTGTPAGGPALRQALFCDLAPVRAAPPPPTMAFFPGTQNVMLRSGWEPAAFFAGLHAGSNGVNHAHLDLGTFSVIQGGERVLGDSGSWPYTLDYFQRAPGGRRWDYEPNTTAGHNALLVDGAGQEPGDDAHCRFHQVDLHPGDGLALLAVDLTPAYGDRLGRYVRHFAYLDEGLLMIVDEIVGVGEHRLAWCGHPSAAPQPVANGWQWQAGAVAAQLRLLGLREEDGFVLSEAQRHTRYVDRVGHPQAYTTHAVRAATLHRVREWTVVAALLTARELAAEQETPTAVRVSTARRQGRVFWENGRIRWRPM